MRKLRMASRASPMLTFSAVALAIASSNGACTCSKAPQPTASTENTASSATPSVEAASATTPSAEPGGLSAPIAASHGDNGDVVVAGLDVPAKSIRVQRINDKDEVVADKTVLPGVSWSTESELKVLAASGGVAVTWRGNRNGKLVRQLVMLDANLAPKGEPASVAAASCATQDALWFTDGARVHTRPWASAPTHSELPKDKDASLVCGAHRAFALLDEDDGTSFIALGTAGASPVRLFDEAQFGDDDQRERPEFTVGDDLGVVRLGISGAVTIREVKSGTVGPLHRLKTSLSRDADVVAVDASSRIIVVVYTEDVSDACPAEKGSSGTASTRVKALRIDRTSFEESVVELFPGACGRDVGPFFTAAMGDAVRVAWVERVSVVGKARAPIAGLASRTIPASGAPPELTRLEQPADALVDATCDQARCYAVALARRTGMDAMVPGVARVLRY
jgi:hypothetical protein